jgi:hypothetical protein
VYSDGTRIPVKQLNESMIRQFRAANKPFCHVRSIEPIIAYMRHCFLCFHPLTNQGRTGDACTTRSLAAALNPLSPFAPRPAICWRACELACSVKRAHLERPAVQDSHCLTAPADVARRCQTRPQDSPTLHVQRTPKFGAFLIHMVG